MFFVIANSMSGLLGHANLRALEQRRAGCTVAHFDREIGEQCRGRVRHIGAAKQLQGARDSSSLPNVSVPWLSGEVTLPSGAVTSTSIEPRFGRGVDKLQLDEVVLRCRPVSLGSSIVIVFTSASVPYAKIV